MKNISKFMEKHIILQFNTNKGNQFTIKTLKTSNPLQTTFRVLTI
jgi:hypothetical protein